MTAAPLPSLSVVIPTLNEAAHLPALLDDLKKQHISLEIIIGDGGSSDGTEAVSRASGARFVNAGRGRGVQMNAAAERASGDYLLFLHADSRIAAPDLLSRAVRAISEQKCGDGRTAGHFSLRFMRNTARNSLAYRYCEEKSALNRINTTNGDQGLLIPREFFTELGGFDESMPFLEDQRIAAQIHSLGRWMTLPGCIETSARRFEAEGFHRRYILMGMMMGLFSIGAGEFFARAPGVYRVQQESGTLFLSPFFALIRRLMRHDWGLRGSVRAFYLLGKYIRQNSWQLFFFLDVCCRPLFGNGCYPFLRFHDQVFAPCTRFAPFNAVAGLACFIWYMGVLAPYFRLTERRRAG